MQRLSTAFLMIRNLYSCYLLYNESTSRKLVKLMICMYSIDTSIGLNLKCKCLEITFGMILVQVAYSNKRLQCKKESEYDQEMPQS